MTFCSYRSFAATVIVPVVLAFLYKQVNKDLPKYRLAIGILSARENFSQRSAIRSTWLTVLNKTEVLKDVLVKFVLASEDCGIPIADRKSKYICEEIRPFNPGSFEVWDLHSLGTHSTKVEFGAFPSEYATVAFDFTVIFDVVISGISTPSPNENAILQLWDLASEILVVESSPQKHADYLWDSRDIESYLLPKGFVGSVVVHCLGKSGCMGVKKWFDPILFPAAIEISPFLRYSRHRNEFPINILPTSLDALILPASFRFELADTEKVTNFLKSKPARLEKHRQELLIIDKALSKEINQHQDILILPEKGDGGLVEVYQNLPKKVVRFHEWCDGNIDSDYIMKTDDDSYVDIEALAKALDHTQSTKPIWFGNFRRDWIVDRFGKWAEHDYTASVYPVYACGAGYVISKALSKYLAENGGKIKYYQGEDVSMGIWMSGLDVNHVQDDRVMCDDSCSEDMLVTTQHSPMNLRRLWRNKLNCGSPCSCS